MDNNKKIVKALLEKNYVDAKECVFNALYAKASLLLDEERVGIAAELFSEDKKMGMYSHDQDEEAEKTKKKSKGEKPSMYEEVDQVDEAATAKFNRVSKALKKAKTPERKRVLGSLEARLRKKKSKREDAVYDKKENEDNMRRADNMVDAWKDEHYSS